MSATSAQYAHLAPNPKSAYKQLFIKGTRIRAEVIYALHTGSEPMTAAEIAADYKLPLDAVEEAMAYCESNPPELAADYAAEEIRMEARGMKDPAYRYHATPKRLSPQDKARLRCS